VSGPYSLYRRRKSKRKLGSKRAERTAAAISEYMAWRYRAYTAGVPSLTRVERAALDKARALKARETKSAKKLDILANSTAHENMVLQMTENYNNDGFINHNRMLKNTFKAYRLEHPDLNTDDPDVQAEVRQIVGSAPS
jgi:hypothetical protein